MTSKNLLKSICLFVTVLSILVCGGCSNENIVSTANNSTLTTEKNNISNVEVIFDTNSGRSFSPTKYKVIATNESGTKESESSIQTVTLQLTAGKWSFQGICYDSKGIEIYKGASDEVEISTSKTTVQIWVLKNSGNLTVDVSAYSANNSNIKTIEVEVSKETFDSQKVSVNAPFTDKALFQGLAAGDWTVKVTDTSSQAKVLDTFTKEVIPQAYVEVTPAGTGLSTTATPVITPASGTYDEDANLILEIKCSEAATFYYTTDGSVPTVNSKQYFQSQTIPITSSVTISAIAVADGKKVSEVATSSITIRPKVTVPDPGSDPTPAPDPVIGKIVLHVYGYTHIWAWNDDNNYTGGKWPGVAMEQENEKWYTYTLEDLTKCSLLFSNSGSSQTADLSITEGEWWYKDGTFLTSNPDDAVAPVLVTFEADKTPNATGNVTFTASATDDVNLSKVELVANGSAIGSIKMSGTSGSGSFVWDTTKVKNATYSVVATAFDAAGNKSASQTVNVTTKNTFTPVAVITGAKSAIISAAKEYSASGSVYLGTDAMTYAWSITGGGSLSSTTAEKVTLTMPSAKCEITLTLTVTAGGKTSTATQTIKVNEKSASSGDFREESIYFLMTTRFYDGDPNNNEYCWDEGGEYLPYGEGDCAWRGDFKGLIEKLDYIKALGFSAIWITPVVQNSSGIDYHGYHAYDFKTVDPRYESTGATFQDLIDACHAKGIKVVQDIVLNHTGNFGEKNLFNMFKKDTEPYVNKDLPLPSGAKWPRSPFYSVNEEGNAYSKLMAGLAMQNAGNTTAAYNSAIGGIQYGARINAMKEDSIDTDLIYHHAKMIDWNSINCQLGQMAGDCVDINTENPTVIKYLIEAYSQYIEMGVDAFRIDTVKHINRLIFNKYFNPAFMEAAKQSGNDNFYMFGEVCARYRGRWNEGVPSLSPSFYTWKETEAPFTGEVLGSYGTEAQNTADTAANFAKYASGFTPPTPTSGSNTFLKGNDYHTPDYTNKADLCVIDFPMHWAFKETGDAFNTALQYDSDYSDATWNVVYVDSHDYAPDNAPENKRFTGYWPDKLNLMWTFRGIPCIYYGSEIAFMKGAAIDAANERVPLNESGRAYFGDHLEGTVTASDYGVYTASGKVEETLNNALAQQIIALNKIRRAVPALQKGQYSTEGCSGGISFKRRYTNAAEGVDSFALVAINGQATFSGIPSGNYTEMVTGKKVSSSGSLTSDAIGTGNMRVYVLNYDGESGFKGGTLQ